MRELAKAKVVDDDWLSMEAPEGEEAGSQEVKDADASAAVGADDDDDGPVADADDFNEENNVEDNDPVRGLCCAYLPPITNGLLP